MKLRSALIFVCMIATTAVRAELVMELSTPRTHYIQHEPLWVVLTFRNTGTNDEKLVRVFETCLDYVTYHITPPDGKRYRYDSIAKGSGLDLRELLTVCLGPGESFSADVDLSCEMGDPGEHPESYDIVDTLSRPGEYRFEAAYSMPGNPRINLQSNECQITVHEPTGIDRKAHDLLLGPPRYSKEMEWLAQCATESWQQVVDRCPTSAYAPYALFNLAYDYKRGRSLESQAMKPVKRARDAARLYEKCAKRLADSPLGAQAFGMAAGCYHDAGDSEQNRRMLEAQLTCKGMTDEQRLHALAFLFVEERKPPFADYAESRVPLRQIAESLGFAVTWNPADKTAEVSNARVHITVRPEDVSDGRMMVSLKVLAPLVADRYGRCRETGQKH